MADVYDEFCDDMEDEHDGVAKVKKFLLTPLQLDYLNAMLPVFEICFKAGTTACKAKMPTGVFYLSIIEQTCQEIFTCRANTVHAKTQQFGSVLTREIHKRFTENVVEPHLLML